MSRGSPGDGSLAPRDGGESQKYGNLSTVTWVRTDIVLMYMPTRHRNKLYTNPCACGCMTRTAVPINCCVRTRRTGGVERRGEAKTAISAPLWRGSTTFFFCPCTLPRLWHSSAYLLLYCCCTAVVLLSYTDCGFVGCRWMFFSAVYCAVLLLSISHGTAPIRRDILLKDIPQPLQAVE